MHKRKKKVVLLKNSKKQPISVLGVIKTVLEALKTLTELAKLFF